MAKKAKKAACAEPVIVASKVKAYVKGKGMMSSKDFLCALNCSILEVIDKAAARAKENKRSTVQPRDV
jgi:histone H3/H4